MDPAEPDPHPPTHELRRDRLSGEWVLIAAHRQGRPNLPAQGCPFCIGGLEAPDRYTVRAFPNRWPPLVPGPPVATHTGDSEPDQLPPRGAAEVVLFSPDHDASLSTIGLDAVARVVDLWADRTEALLARPEIEYVLVFENRGAEVGATIHHPHGQIYGYPFVPPTVAREATGVAGAQCPVCAEIDGERVAGSRVVVDDGEWVAWVPYASANSYGMRLAPRAHVGRIAELDAPARKAFAAALVDTLGRYDRLWGRDLDPDARAFPYLLWFHQAPAHHDGEYHLHAHLAPPLRAPGVLRYVASGELGGGLLANPVAPERAAAELRAAGAR